MSLPHAILTALTEKPSTGLELTRRIDKSIRYFWPATHQQVYRELGRLENAGLVQARSAPGVRKEYQVLPAGHEELTAWLARAEDPKPLRDSLLLRLRAAAIVGTAGLKQELDRHRALHQAQLDEYLEIEEHDFTPRPESEKDRLQYLVLQAGIGFETHWVSWIETALAELTALEQTA